MAKSVSGETRKARGEGTGSLRRRGGDERKRRLESGVRSRNSDVLLAGWLAAIVAFLRALHVCSRMLVELLLMGWHCGHTHRPYDGLPTGLIGYDPSRRDIHQPQSRASYVLKSRDLGSTDYARGSSCLLLQLAVRMRRALTQSC